ncbi:MAG: nucleoside-diphosphate-sugar epimerase [Cryomorphaceae bacterium]|jgi:nucleoside-diphosphate-sugar epimerase
MKIAITGANGFIGGNLISVIWQNTIDVEIIAIVRNASRVDIGNVRKLTIVQMDIHNPPDDVYQAIGSPDVLIHLAWGGLPNYNSLHHFESELPTHYKFLSELVKNGLKSLVVAGTCFEYGMQSGELEENMAAVPDNPYGFAKNTLREQLEYLQKEIEFNLTWTRLFYIYGNNQTGNSIFPQLKKAIENGDDTFNMSKGEQIRDYLDVKRVAKNILDLAVLEEDIGIINICSGAPISIKNHVEEWLEKYSWEIKLNLGHYPYPTHESLVFWGRNSKLKSYIDASS